MMLMWLCLAPTFAQKDTVTVISFNIRYNNPGDGDNIWDNRKEAAAAMVLDQRPAAFGVLR